MRLDLPVNVGIETDIEFALPDGVILVSRANLSGVITYCNQAFCDASGYSESELLGMSHNIIRHPDVPAEVFADCWLTIQFGGNWHGILKNRRKGGGYYWVDAHISPWLEEGRIVGYVSLRYKPTAEQIVMASLAYEEVRSNRLRAKDAFGRSEDSYIASLQQRLASKMMELEGYHSRHEQEKRVGRYIMERLTQMPPHLSSAIRRYSLPADQLNGDALIAATTPTELVYIMLADAVGHGLAAAINVLPLCRTFYAMAHKGFSLWKIAQELNMLVLDVMPRERFVAATLISIDPRTGVYEVWNAGCPSPMLVGSAGNVIHDWPSRHPPLGLIGMDKFDAKPEVFHCSEVAQLYLYSDGLNEAGVHDGAVFGDKLTSILSGTPPERRFDAIVAGLAQHMQGRPAHDDISLAMFDSVPVDANESLSCTIHPGREPAKDHDWRFSITLEASELKYIDVVPMLMQNICNVNAAKEHEGALFLILSELYNNSLEHGILQLDSAIKQGEDGFEQYFELRDKRLKALNKGKISIETERVTIDGMQAIRISVTDSGNGFDVRRLAFREFGAEVDAVTQHGRGIALVRSITHKIEYHGNGNHVVAYYITDAARG